MFTPIPPALQNPSCPAHDLRFCFGIHNSPQNMYTYIYIYVCIYHIHCVECVSSWKSPVLKKLFNSGLEFQYIVSTGNLKRKYVQNQGQKQIGHLSCAAHFRAMATTNSQIRTDPAITIQPACTCRGSRRCGRSGRGASCRAGVNRDGINGNITPPVSTSRRIFRWLRLRIALLRMLQMRI